VPLFKINKGELSAGIPILDLLAEKIKVFTSKGELRRLMKDNGLSINQEKEQNVEKTINADDLINNQFILIRKGKKKYFLIIAE
jgi:tyrosyl-tRNA synthetase